LDDLVRICLASCGTANTANALDAATFERVRMKNSLQSKISELETVKLELSKTKGELLKTESLLTSEKSHHMATKLKLSAEEDAHKRTKMQLEEEQAERRQRPTMTNLRTTTMSWRKSMSGPDRGCWNRNVSFGRRLLMTKKYRTWRRSRTSTRTS
jgi:hypothetical protein